MKKSTKTSKRRVYFNLDPYKDNFLLDYVVLGQELNCLTRKHRWPFWPFKLNRMYLHSVKKNCRSTSHTFEHAYTTNERTWTDITLYWVSITLWFLYLEHIRRWIPASGLLCKEVDFYRRLWQFQCSYCLLLRIWLWSCLNLLISTIRQLALCYCYTPWCFRLSIPKLTRSFQAQVYIPFLRDRYKSMIRGKCGKYEKKSPKVWLPYHFGQLPCKFLFQVLMYFSGEIYVPFLKKKEGEAEGILKNAYGTLTQAKGHMYIRVNVIISQ